MKFVQKLFVRNLQIFRPHPVTAQSLTTENLKTFSIQIINAKRKAMGLKDIAPGDYLRLLKENDLPNLARIFTERRYRAEDNVAFSKLFMQVLESQGFMNF